MRTPQDHGRLAYLSTRLGLTTNEACLRALVEAVVECLQGPDVSSKTGNTDVRIVDDQHVEHRRQPAMVLKQLMYGTTWC